MRRLIDFRLRVHRRERVAVLAELVDDRLRRLLQLLGREAVARLDLDELLELGLAIQQIAGELHARYRVRLAFVQRHRQVHVLLVRRDRHLRRLDVELQVPAVQVVRAHVLEVARQLFLRVQVVLRVPREPVRRGQLHLVAQRARLERLVADEVDLANLRARAFGDREQDRHAVRVDRRDRRRHFRRVEAARQILALELLLRLVDERLVVVTPLRQAHGLQRLVQVVLVEFLDAGEVDRRDRRTLLHLDDHDAALRRDPHVVEEARRVQRANRLGCLVVGERIALLDRQVGEHGTRFDALQAFDLDVLHHEGRRCVCRETMRGERRGSNRLRYEAMRFEQHASPVFKLASDQAATVTAAARRVKNGLTEPDR